LKREREGLVLYFSMEVWTSLEKNERQERERERERGLSFIFWVSEEDDMEYKERRVEL